MRLRQFQIYLFAKWALIVAGSISLLSATVLFLAMLFNFKPYIQVNEDDAIGYLDYSKGAPVLATSSSAIPDTSLYLHYRSGSGSSSPLINIYGNRSEDYIKKNLPPADSLVYADTIVTKYMAQGNPMSRVRGAEITQMKFYLQPQNFFERVLFFLPTLLQLLLVSWCAFQLGLLMQFIIEGQTFTQRNYGLLQKVGWGIVLVEIAFWLLDFPMLFYFNQVHVDLESGIPHYRRHMDIVANLSSPFDWSWLIAGCILLVIARAFRTGHHLQTDKDLTI